MLNKGRRNAFVLVCAIGVGVVAVSLWGLASRKPGKARADEVALREPIDSGDPQTAEIPVRRSPDLASIPWKRDCASYASIAIGIAQLPWIRSSGQPTAVAIRLADLPWNEARLSAYAPAALPMVELPWRY